jgi:isoleucyl-tRNA synthetase
MADDLSSPATTAPEATQRDYRETVFLPETPFPMRAGLPKLEPQLLEQWEAGEGLYRQVRAKRQAEGAPLYVLHDGPPYANGAIHIGHALNKTLKDFVVRSRFALGYDVDYVPGWDCHGLPIEWKVEEQFRAKGRRKDEVSKAEFRTACRAYADQWINAQRTEFKRLGVLGRWDDPYLTMAFGSEAAIVAEFHKFLMSGQLYRGSKPVMWSPVERTALADAEVEYHPHQSPTIWVKFPVIAAPPGKGEALVRDLPPAPAEGPGQAAARPSGMSGLEGASVVIWTTTPWTIPANRAISFNPEVAYGLYEVEAMETDLPFDPWAKPGDRLIVADKLAEEVRQAAKIAAWRRIEPVEPTGMICAHPLANLDPGYGFPVPLLAGDHVTDDAGTGFVHTAPGHGADDYAVWLANGHRDIPDTVDPDGAYYPSVPLFGGLKVMETEGKKAGKFGPANNAVIDKLIEAGNLLARGRVDHSYPHSWRSKAPILFRNTPQWFIRMDSPLSLEGRGAGGEGERGALSADGAGGASSDLSGNPTANTPIPNPSPLEGEGRTLRQLALAAIDATAFHPETGKNRIRGMVEGRPDWLISRQRAWGTPLAMFVDKRTGEPLRDPEVNARIVAAIEAEGADAWFTRPDADFLGEGRDPADYEKVEDILDVWFDSGSTHAFTLEGRETGPDRSRSPADLYLEGTDQARGWFQSSLLESCGTRGHAPYKAVLTHGFTMAEDGQKMSKSLGNTVEPQSVIAQSGAEIIRLWVAMVDYAEDQRIGPAILQTTTDAYRKLRNTVRYLLGALEGFTEAERVEYADMPPLERFILHRLWQLDGHVRAAYEGYRFNEVFRPVSEFCAGDLSALYFDIRKDSLYCDRPDALRRRAARTVMHEVFMRLTIWLAPLLPFTTEEAWGTRFPDAGPNALRVLPERAEEWENWKEAKRWGEVKKVTEMVTSALEIMRRDKEIGSPLEAAPKVFYVEHEPVEAFSGLDAAEIFRTSEAQIAYWTETDMSKMDQLIEDGRWIQSSKPYDVTSRDLAQGLKCDRCWRILPEVKPETKLCQRCDDAVKDWNARHGR